MGKSRAAAFAMGLQDIDESVHVNAFSDALDDAETNENSHPEGTLSIYPLNMKYNLYYYFVRCMTDAQIYF